MAGERFVHKPYDGLDPRGTFDLNLQQRAAAGGEGHGGRARRGGAAARRRHGRGEGGGHGERTGGLALVRWERQGYGGPVWLNGTIHDRGGIWDGQGQLPGDVWIPWSAVKQRGNGGKERGTNGRSALDSLWAAPLGEVCTP